MPDESILQSAVHAVPDDYAIAGTQSLAIRSVTGSFDGSAAAAFVPTMEIIDAAGNVIGAYPLSSTVAGGGTADVSFFPGVNRGSLVTSPVFHDTADDGFNQDRWALTTIQLRNASLDTASAGAWALCPAANPYTASFTVSQTGERVYAFTDKDFIRTLTSNAPFADDWNVSVPDFVSGPIQWAAHTTGAGSGAVTYSANLAAGDLSSGLSIETMLVGFAPNGGVPTEVSRRTSFVDLNPYAAALVPTTTLPGDILLVVILLRQANAVANMVAPSGWTLLCRSPNRGEDPLCGQDDQFLYMRTVS